ncbi:MULTISPECIES: DUF3941 domain-containing protein [Pontibacillus]|uniref:DUF3941 domain-containing protein n=1 Tax=Pontibacillus chungwhensis TaxID=265426 RepID=A0ABY8UZS9_9BACI|nr:MULTISPECIES: DUF3941 domain-containing protein [Pontibacillus]MCD5324719.1 DUF3941 domain-containing protein [Pontibacillus sp. HN14]WIF98989.1 DUF3941 domain-containing protein [Pontibacillus chungwhensis]
MATRNTGDNNKKPLDNNAKRAHKNEQREAARQNGERQFSKKTDHK